MESSISTLFQSQNLYFRIVKVMYLYDICKFFLLFIFILNNAFFLLFIWIYQILLYRIIFLV